MLLSKQSLLSDQQAITASAASTNIMDLGATGTPIRGNQLVRDIGAGTPVGFLAQVTEAFTAAGAGTLTVSLEVDDNSGFSSATTVWTSGAIPKATLVAGYRLPIEYLPKGINERYFRLYYTVATGPMTAGKITAGLMLDGQDSNIR
jgi:hypothetical protein